MPEQRSLDLQLGILMGKVETLLKGEESRDKAIADVGIRLDRMEHSNAEQFRVIKERLDAMAIPVADYVTWRGRAVMFLTGASALIVTLYGTLEGVIREWARHLFGK